MIMKLTLVLILFCTFSSFAGIKAQTVTINAANKEIAQVLSAIEKQGDYRFVFNSRLKDLKQKVSVSFSEALLKDVLLHLFAGTSLTFQEMENNLVAVRSVNDADITVSGKVTDQNGTGISGASVVVKGGSGGTKTDAGGNFTISSR